MMSLLHTHTHTRRREAVKYLAVVAWKYITYNKLIYNFWGYKNNNVVYIIIQPHIVYMNFICIGILSSYLSCYSIRALALVTSQRAPNHFFYCPDFRPKFIHIQFPPLSHDNNQPGRVKAITYFL